MSDLISRQPPEQPDVPDTNVGDMISRQAAITINLNELPKYTIQRTVEVSDESIEKIADAVVRKLADHKTEPQTGKE